MREQDPVITPAELKNYDFSRKWRGYDAVQVREVIALAAEAIEQSLLRINSLSMDVERLEEKVAEFERMEATIKETLVTAQVSVDEIRKNASKEVDLMRREAEAEVSRQTELREQEAARLRADIERLKDLRRNYLIQLKSLIKGHQEMLERLPDSFQGLSDTEERALPSREGG